MSELQIFNNPDFGEIRMVERDGEPWFVAADVCRALDVSDTWNALQRLDDDEKGTYSISTPGGEQKMNIVNEPGLYSLVLGSRKPEAKAFKRWMTHEVIPTIRKTGGYLTPEAADRLAAAVQERVQAAWAEPFQKLCARVEALEDAVTDPFRFVPAAPAPLPAGGAPEAAHPGRDYMKRWMRTASEKLDLMSSKFNMSSNAILHKLYGYLEEDFGVVMADERIRIMEQFGLEDCSTLKAVFYDEDLRDRLEELIDYNLAPENRGW